MPHLLAVFFRDTGHPGDDLDGEWTGEVLNHIEMGGVHGVEISLNLLGDRVALGPYRPGRERLVEQTAHVSVLGRVHEDDRLLWWLVGSHHRQVAPAGRRVRLKILERRGDIDVSRQSVKILLLAVVQGCFVPHSSVDVERVVEIVVTEGVEDQFRFGHQFLLKGAPGLDMCRSDLDRMANSRAYRCVWKG